MWIGRASTLLPLGAGAVRQLSWGSISILAINSWMCGAVFPLKGLSMFCGLQVSFFSLLNMRDWWNNMAINRAWWGRVVPSPWPGHVACQRSGEIPNTCNGGGRAGDMENSKQLQAAFDVHNMEGCQRRSAISEEENGTSVGLVVDWNGQSSMRTKSCWWRVPIRLMVFMLHFVFVALW